MEFKVIDFERSMYAPKDFELHILYYMIRQPWKHANEECEKYTKVEDYKNIMGYIEKYYPEKLKERYQIDKLNDDILVDLEEIGKRRGCLIKGGEIDYDKVLNLIMTDIKNGYIKEITFDRNEDYE